MCNKYTTNLQLVHMFKDPQTVDQTERAVQALWCSLEFMNAQNTQNTIQTYENKRDTRITSRVLRFDFITRYDRPENPASGLDYIEFS